MTSLTNALPLKRGISNQICFLLRKYMQEVHPWMIQIFGVASYAYVKSDLASIQRPGIFIYPLNANKKSYSYKYTGIIVMELHFSLQEQRQDLAENVIQIAEDIMLINLNQEFTYYLQASMPGLFEFGKYAEVDYSKVYDKEAIVKLQFDFWIELQAYQIELQRMGCDITSPDKQIYYPAQALNAAFGLINDPPDPAIIANTTIGNLEVNTDNETTNLAINPDDNSQILEINTF